MAYQCFIKKVNCFFVWLISCREVEVASYIWRLFGTIRKMNLVKFDFQKCCFDFFDGKIFYSKCNFLQKWNFIITAVLNIIVFGSVASDEMGIEKVQSSTQPTTEPVVDNVSLSVIELRVKAAAQTKVFHRNEKKRQRVPTNRPSMVFAGCKPIRRPADGQNTKSSKKRVVFSSHNWGGF